MSVNDDFPPNTMATSADLDLAADLVRESHPDLAAALKARAEFVAEVEEDPGRDINDEILAIERELGHEDGALWSGTLDRALKRAEHHLAKTRQNWTPGIAEAERDVAALREMIAGQAS